MKTIQRTVSLSLDNSTSKKKQRLEDFLFEFKKVVNQYIDILWDYEKLPIYIKTEERRKIDSWFLSKISADTGNYALGIVKSARVRNEKLIRKKYNRIYAKCKKLERNHFGILDKHYHEWIKGKKLKCRVKKPVFDKDIIEAGNIQFQDPKKAKSFDKWLRLTGIFPNKYFPCFPVKKHKLFNKYLNDGYQIANSVRIRKAKDGKFYLDVFFKKEGEEPLNNQNENSLGIDLGLNKLLSLSDGRKLGPDIKRLIQKLNRRKQGSRNWEQTLSEIKSYIGYSINQIGIENFDLIVMEDLKKSKMISKDGSNSKGLRKLLGYWNLDLVYRRIKNKCELNRVQFELVNPSYTSQQCSNCGEIHKESRNGEEYICKACGYQEDADINASKNILHRFLCREVSIPYDTKS